MTRGAEPSTGERARQVRATVADLAFLLLVVSVIVVPAWLRSVPEGAVVVGDADTAPVLIDVNRAAWYEWALLEGIGEKRGRSLVEYREAHGPFLSIEQLEEVPGMPAGWVTRAREHLSLREELPR